MTAPRVPPFLRPRLQPMDITLPSAFPVHFVNGHQALALEMTPALELSQALTLLQLQPSRPILVLVGGASGLQDSHFDVLSHLFQDSLCPWLQARGFGVVDGGTEAGIMQLMGEAYHQTQCSFPLVGVAAQGTIVLPQDPSDATDERAQLDPHHPFFLLVPGQDWGDEAPWLAKLAHCWAGAHPSVTLVVNGGGITFQDVAESVALGRPVVVVAGSGRTADSLAAALEGDRSDAQASALVQSGLIHSIHLEQASQDMLALLDRLIAVYSG